jgi:hypothetical protein
MNTNTQTTTDDADFDALDRSLEDIEDIPSFDVPPLGTYQLLVCAELKKLPKDDKNPTERGVVVLNYEITDVVQLADPTEKPPVIGSKFGEMFMLGNEFGEGNMKKSFSPYATHFGVTNMKSLVRDLVQNVVVTATVKHRFNKKDDPKKEVPYAQVLNVVIQ